MSHVRVVEGGQVSKNLPNGRFLACPRRSDFLSAGKTTSLGREHLHILRILGVKYLVTCDDKLLNRAMQDLVLFNNVFKTPYNITLKFLDIYTSLCYNMNRGGIRMMVSRIGPTGANRMTSN